MPNRPSSFALLAGIIDRPGTALAEVVAHPRWRWVLPTILALAVLAATAVLTYPQVSIQTEQLVAQQLSQLPADQVESVRARMETFQSPIIVVGTRMVLGSLGLAFGWLVKSGVLYISAVLAGKDIEFGQLFAAAPWLGLPFVLEQLLQTGWTMYSGELIVNQGLSYLVSSGRTLEDARSLSYGGLSQVSLFRLWHLILVYALLRTLGRFKGGGASWLTVVYAVVTIGGAIAFTLLTARLSPSL